MAQKMSWRKILCYMLWLHGHQSLKEGLRKPSQVKEFHFLPCFGSDMNQNIVFHRTRRLRYEIAKQYALGFETRSELLRGLDMLIQGDVCNGFRVRPDHAEGYSLVGLLLPKPVLLKYMYHCIWSADETDGCGWCGVL